MVTLKGSVAVFRFLRPQARRVFLVGEFNAWETGSLPMTRGADGFWTAVMHLAPGEYRFRYRADGHWFTDFAAFGVTQGRFGFDSVVRIPPGAGPAADLASPLAHALV